MKALAATGDNRPLSFADLSLAVIKLLGAGEYVAEIVLTRLLPLVANFLYRPARAFKVFEDTYIIPRAHQTYIEPQTTVADVSPDGKVTVWTSTQGHFAVRSNLANSLRMPLSKINVVGMTIGGGFGAKFGAGEMNALFAVLASAGAAATSLGLRRR